jgi:hypothetical protein
LPFLACLIPILKIKNTPRKILLSVDEKSQSINSKFLKTS